MKRIEFWMLGALLVATVFPAIGSSLWLDEAGTWWIVKDGLADTWSRAMSWSATSPLYYSVAWAFVQVFGLSELALRAPSVLFSAGTAVVLYRLGLRWLDADGSAIGVLFFFCLPAVQFSVIDARPYALGLLLLCWAWLAMMRWVETQRWKEGAVFVVPAAALVWANYTFALGLLPLAWLSRRLGWRRIGLAAASIVALLTPLIFQVAETLGRRGELSWSSPPSLLKLSFTLLPPRVVAYLALTLLLSAFWRKARAVGPSAFQAKQSLVPLALWAALPPLLIFLLSRAGVVQLFEARYLLSKEPGLALLAGWAVRELAIARMRGVTAVAAVVWVLLCNAVFVPAHGNENWRESSEWVNEELRMHAETQVVLVSGFVESLQVRRLDDPAYRGILLAPQLVYPVSGRPILLPWQGTTEAERRLKELVPAVEVAGRVVVVSPQMTAQLKELFAENLGAAGLLLKGEKHFGSLVGLLYERPDTGSAPNRGH